MAIRPEIMATAIFCEDIREEVDGKQSFIGVSLGKTVVEKFPAIIPRFAVTVSATIDQDRNLDDLNITIAISYSDGEHIIFDKPLAPDSETDDIDDVAGYHSISTSVEISPFRIREKSHVVAYISSHSGRIEVGRLHFLGRDEFTPTKSVVIEGESLIPHPKNDQ